MLTGGWFSNMFGSGWDVQRVAVNEHVRSNWPGGITPMRPEQFASHLLGETLTHPICIPDCIVEALAPRSVNDLGVQYHLSINQMPVI